VILKQTNRKLNIVFLGEFSYPHGMAGTKRIQHAIDVIQDDSSVSTSVIVLRQSSKDNRLNGFHDGIKYKTIMGDLLGAKIAFCYPMYYLKTMRALKSAFRSDSDNVIYSYGPPGLLNIGALNYAKRIGYKIVFDIVEDYGTAMSISRSLLHRVKMAGIEYLGRRVKSLASGVIVISSHLQKKYEVLTETEIPIHCRQISVDFDHFQFNRGASNTEHVLFYSGSFGKKDGVPILLEAFDVLASKYPSVRLVLTGKGSEEALQPVLNRISESPHKDRIEYKGYLDDDAYYTLLNSIDIPCMTRIDLAYANAGFPFKLGEFLATGKPVVVSRVSDVESLLDNCKDAMLVKPGDSGEIVGAVEYLIDHSQVAVTIGERGREKARALFDYQVQGRNLLDFIRTI
jgi:glycosyltransferase involved in cell wall biosynthesis